MGIAVTAVTGLLISPISWNHHWVWIVIVLVVVADLAARHWRRSRWRGAALAAGALLVVCAFAAVPPHRLRPPWGWLWTVPSHHDRELHWSGFQHIIGNAYVIVA
jgi:alpha-1,2-mannosyltransferase